MPGPELLAAGLPLVGGVVNSVANILGGDKAAGALKKANTQARSDLTQGYGQGIGYQKPIYDTALGNYTDLSKRYGAGDFNNPHMDAYKFDPQSIFQDPEYQAQMAAGTEAINRGAEAKGNLFSGRNAMDLTKFGQGLFANRSDELYNRGFNATNTAYNQNAQNNATAFNQGNALAGFLPGSANQLTDLSVNQGQDLANNSQTAGAIRAGNIGNTTGALTDLTSGLVKNGSSLLNSFSPKSALIAGEPRSAVMGGRLS